jgi:hypothetical protein
MMGRVGSSGTSWSRMRGTTAWGNNPVEALGDGVWVGGPPLAWVNTYSLLVARCRHREVRPCTRSVGRGLEPNKAGEVPSDTLSTTPEAEVHTPEPLPFGTDRPTNRPHSPLPGRWDGPLV